LDAYLHDRKLTNDGTANPTGNEFNAIGWYLQDKWGIAGNFVEPVAGPVTPGPLRVDFSQSTSVPLQAGFDGFSFNDASSHTLTYANAAASDGTIDVTLSGQTHFRDYNTITGGPFLDQSDLLSDSALRNANGVMTLTLGDLNPGSYEITTYHHSTQNDDGIFDLYLTDSVVTNSMWFSDVTIPDDSRTPTDITTLTFNFVSDGSDVVIGMDMTGGRQVKFNGFELSDATGGGAVPILADLNAETIETFTGFSSLTAPSSVVNGVTMAISGHEAERNREQNDGVLSSGSAFIADGTNIDALIDDLVFNNNDGGAVTVTISDLPAGTYDVESWHWEPIRRTEFAGFTIDVAVDGIVVLDDVLGFSDTTPLSYQIISDGTNPVVIEFSENDNQVRFNGIALRLAESAVPEPSTFVLAALGLLGLGWYGRKRWK